MPKWKATLDDGRVVTLEGDTQPTEADVIAAIGSYKPATQTATSQPPSFAAMAAAPGRSEFEPPPAVVPPPPVETPIVPRGESPFVGLKAVGPGFGGQLMPPESTAASGFEAFSKPFVPIPAATPETVRKAAPLMGPGFGGQIAPPSEFGQAAAAEALNQIKGLVEFAESPLGVTTAGAGAGGSVIQKLIGAGYAADIARNIPDAYRAARDAKTPAEKGQAYVRLAATLAMPVALALPTIRGFFKKPTPQAQAIEAAKPILPRAAAAAEEVLAETPEKPAAPAATTEVTSASEIPSPEIVPQLEVRPQVGETPPLRQQGQLATAGEAKAQAPEVAPTQKGTAPITFDTQRKHLVDAQGRFVDADGNLLESPPPSTGPPTEVAASTETPTTTPQPSAKAGIQAQNPIEAWHASKSKIARFDNRERTELSSMGFHFGTEEQAKFRTGQYDFGSKTPYVAKYLLDIKNPLEVSHMASFAPDHLADQMADMGILDLGWYEQLDRSNMSEPEVGDLLVKILKENGYDGLKYKNEREGEGYSYVPFDAKQITEAKSTPTKSDFGATTKAGETLKPTPPVEKPAAPPAAPAAKEPPAPKPAEGKVSTDAKEFKRLVEEYGEKHGWIPARLADIVAGATSATGQTHLGGAGIKAKIEAQKALSKAYTAALKDIGITDQKNSPKVHAEALPKLKEFLKKQENLQHVALEQIPAGSKFTILGEEYIAGRTDPDTGLIVVEDGRRLKLDENATIGIDPGSLKAPKGAADFLPPEEGFELAKAESVQEQTKRLATEKTAAETKQTQEAAAEQARLKAQGRIGGTLGSAGQGSLFTEPGQQEIFAPKPADQLKPVAGPVAKTEKAPKRIGMGGAIPEEFEAPRGTPTSNKNAVVDAERQRRGLPPMMTALRQTWADAWDRAMAKIDQDPSFQDRLISELQKKPRALEPWENAALLQRRADLRNEYDKSARDASQAYDDGRTADMAEANVRTAMWSDKLAELESVTKPAGSETGRALAARKMMMNEDFTLAALEMQKRADRGGAPITDAERAELRKIADDYKRTSEALQKSLDEKTAQVAELEVKAALAQVAAAAAREPTIHPRIIEAANRIVATLDSRADAARIRLREKMARMSAGIDPTMLVDLAEIGASHLAHGAVDFAKWSVKMKSDIGDWVQEHLDKVWKLSNAEMDRASAGSPAVKRAIKQGTPETQQRAILDTIKEKVEADEKSAITYQIQKLAKAFWMQGIRNREQMVDALTEAINKVVPMERRQVAEAFAGYGEYRQLNKSEMMVGLRGMKGELQQIAKLEAMQRGEPPLKSGLERRTPTETERKLIKLVNDAKSKFQIPVSDPETQLKSSLDTLKTTLTNRIKDYEDRIARKDFAPRPRRELVLDQEAIRLKAENERVKLRWEKMREQDRLANLPKWQKMLDAFVKWERAFKLSSPVVFGKLTAAAITRVAETIASESVGGVLGKIPGIRTIAEQAPREGGVNAKAMAKAFTAAFTEGMKDAAQTAKTGMTNLEIAFGREARMDKEWANFFGQLHGMMKAPIKRAEYTLSLEKRLEHAIASGVDVTDPMVQMRLQVEALDDGFRSIFMQRGFTSDTFLSTVRMMEQSKTHPVGGMISARAMRFLFPIVRVPVNIVAETATGVYGAPVASARTMFHAINGTLSKLDPKVADSIMRQFKKGSIGLGLMAIGYFSPQMVGGYDWREKRKPTDPKAFQFRIGDTDIPKWMTHAPWFELMQMGATMRRTKDQKIKGEERGIPESMWAAGVGLIEQTPYMNEMVRLARASESFGGATGFSGELLRSTVVPQAVDKLASMTDTADVQRRPRTILQHIEMGIPGLRQNVPPRTAVSPSY